MGRLGPTEILLLLALALLLFGPRRLPEMGRALGRTIREFRGSMGAAQEEMKKAAAEEPEEGQPEV